MWSILSLILSPVSVPAPLICSSFLLCPGQLYIRIIDASVIYVTKETSIEILLNGQLGQVLVQHSKY